MDWRNWMDLRRFEWQNGDLQMVSCQGHRSFEAKWWKWKFKRIATELRCCPLLKSTMLGVFGQGYPLYPQFRWALVGGEVYGKCYEVLRQIAMKLRTDSISIDLLFFRKIVRSSGSPTSRGFTLFHPILSILAKVYSIAGGWQCWLWNVAILPGVIED